VAPPTTTLIAVGSSARLGIDLAAALGLEHGVVLLEPPVWSGADTEAWLREGLPGLTPVWSGGHLLEAWHLARDSRLFSPWFRRGAAGRRPGEPDLDDRGIHADVRDLLRANGAWQALLRDLLSARPTERKRPEVPAIALAERPGDWADVLARGDTSRRPSR
jgi:hypothetical protein